MAYSTPKNSFGALKFPKVVREGFFYDFGLQTYFATVARFFFWLGVLRQSSSRFTEPTLQTFKNIEFLKKTLHLARHCACNDLFCSEGAAEIIFQQVSGASSC